MWISLSVSASPAKSSFFFFNNQNNLRLYSNNIEKKSIGVLTKKNNYHGMNVIDSYFIGKLYFKSYSLGGVTN